MTISSDRVANLNYGAAIKLPVKAATTGSITLAGAQTIDGVAVTLGDRVLVKDQGTANGIYDVTLGAWARAVDFDGQNDIVEGTLVYVNQGTVNAERTYRLTTASPAIGASLSFEQAHDADGVTFTQLGTGAVERTVDSKLRDVVSVKDFGPNVQTSYDAAIAAVSAAGGGTVVAPAGYNLKQTGLPVGVVLEYDGPQVPINITEENTPVGGAGTWPAQKVIQGYLPAENNALLHVQAVGPGSGIAGPLGSGIAQSISAVKKNWPLTTATNGEIDGLSIFVRNSGATSGAGAINDASAILMNVGGLTGSGFIVASEVVVTEVNPSTYAIDSGLNAQLAVCNSRDGHRFGLLLQPTHGNGGEGLRVQGLTSSYFTDAVLVTYQGNTVFRVDAVTGNVTSGTLNGVTLNNNAYSTYSPTVAAVTGTITTLGTVVGRYRQIGKTVFFQNVAVITTNGTAADGITFSLPVAANSATATAIASGRESAISGKMLFGRIVSSTMSVLNYDNTHPGANGAIIEISGSYEAA